MAREINKMLGLKNDVKIINGPELLSMYIGQAEKNLRDAFAPAKAEWDAKGEDAELYLIVIDEIDALCRSRSSDSGAGAQVNANLVATLLTLLDGMDSIGNVMVIGMTNRKDMLDSALLRPGRLEIHLEIGLPDLKGRHDIFKIHTATMSSNGLMDRDVNLHELATITKNYSGAEIEGVVKAATSLAVSEKIKLKDGAPEIVREKNGRLKDPMVRMTHFIEAMNDVVPAFGRSEEISKQGPLLDWGHEYKEVIHELKEQVELLKSSTSTNLLTVLISAPMGTGKSSLARKISLESEFPFVKLISPESMSTRSDSDKIYRISSIFEDAYRSPLSIIVIDAIERLVDYSSLGPRFNNNVLQVMRNYLQRDPPNLDCRILVLVTSSSMTALTNLELLESFKVIVNAPMITKPEHVDNIFKLVDFKMDAKEVKELHFLLPRKLGIKNFLLMLDTVRKNPLAEEGGVTAQEFIKYCKSLAIFKLI
jgi:vesicle-fusing ATPase